ncbi:hypothetical protein JCM12825_00330 [Desulfurobacterium crinifex]
MKENNKQQPSEEFGKRSPFHCYCRSVPGSGTSFQASYAMYEILKTVKLYEFMKKEDNPENQQWIQKNIGCPFSCVQSQRT